MHALLLALALSTPAFVTDTLVYGVGDEQSADVVRSDDAKDLPVIVFLHGGVWQFGSRQQAKNVGYAFEIGRASCRERV